MTPLTDTLARPIHDLRISVTDRCNFRCTYCMPKEVFGHDFQFLARDQLLTFEEIQRLARLFVRAGSPGASWASGRPPPRCGAAQPLVGPRRPRCACRGGLTRTTH